MSISITNANVARALPEMAHTRPDQIAVVAGEGRDRAGKPIYRQLSFAELNKVSDRYAWGLTGVGIGRGTRVLLLVPAGVPLIGLTFALMKVGSVPILIDPAMGRRNLAQCIEECAPTAMIGVPRAHLAKLAFRKAFRTVQRSVLVGSRFAPFGDVNLADLSIPVATPFPIEPMAPNDPAAIIFTTGSTGVPKGVLYEHGMFNAQIDLLRDLFQIEPGEVEMPAFPLFALFNVALGCTSAIPPIDPTRPASCDPAEVVEFIRDQNVTSTFGSPAIWARVTQYCVEQGITLPTLRRVLMAGAPVPTYLHERFRQILTPTADTHTPYGATEALPIASASGREILAAHAEHSDPTAGTCVGKAAPGVTLRIISITDEPIAQWSGDLIVPTGQIGEICVKGAAVTKTYINRPKSTAAAKITDGDRHWHRMGDLGYLDEEGRVWFYGRKSHRVETAAGPLYTEPVERVFNQHPAVARSALVGIPTSERRSGLQPAAGAPTSERRSGLQPAAGAPTSERRSGLQPATGASPSSSALQGAETPIVIIEPKDPALLKDRARREALIAELRELGARYPMTAGIADFLIHPSFPVDIRHNAKIFREQLAEWAEKQ